MKVRAVVLVGLAACHKAPPPPTPVAPPAAASSAPPVMDAGMPVDTAANALAEAPARTLAQLWTKRLATAYLAKTELAVKRDAADNLMHALRYVSLDEELAIVEQLVAIAPVLDEVDFTYEALLAKAPFTFETREQILAAENERRLPAMRKLFAKLGPRGRRGMTMYRSEGPLVPALLRDSAAAGVCPAPLPEGARGFEPYERALASIHCPLAPKEPVPAGKESTAADLAPCIAEVARVLVPPAAPREAWFAEVRAREQRHACVWIAGELANRDRKTARAPIAEAFAAADLETRSALVPMMLLVKAPIAKADLDALLADRRTRADVVADHRTEGLGARVAKVEGLDEGIVVRGVRDRFGGPPDLVEPAPPPTKKANDGKPANVRYYRFRAGGDRAAIPPMEYAVGEENGTQWSMEPGTLRAFVEEHIHDARSVSIFENDR